MIVASYNLDSLDDSADDPRDFGARVAALRQKLRALNADVLCLQEIQGQKSSGPSCARMKRDLPDDTQAGPADSSHAPILAEFDLG